MDRPRLRGKAALPLLLLGLLSALPAGAEEPTPPRGTTHLLAPIYFYRGYTVGRGERSSGLQTSHDGGRTWRCRTWPELITNAVAVDETGRYAYVACGNGVMASRDGGQSWRLTGGWRHTEVQRVAIDRRDPKRLWAATAYGVVKTDDAFASGEVWRPSDVALPFRYATDVRQDATDPRTIWVASHRGLFVSRDEGETFAATSVGVPVRRVFVDTRAPTRLLLATDGRGLVRSDDAGKTFARVPGPPDVVFTVVGDPDAVKTLYVGSRAGVHVSRDGGDHWTTSCAGLSAEHFASYGLLRDPDDPQRLVVSGGDGLFESLDGGGTWRRLGFEGALIGDLSAARLANVPRTGPTDKPGSLEIPGLDRLFPDERGEAEPAFQARRKALLASFRARPEPPEGTWIGFGRAAQAVVEGRADESLWAGLSKHLETPTHSMFFSLPLVGFYQHAKARIPKGAAREIQRVLTEVPYYRGDTENHWVMHYAALLLTAQTWPETPASAWYAGRTTQELYEEARGWLLHWARLTATKGQGEFDSPHYMFMYVTPMLLLHEFAREPEIRQMAGMMLDLLLADYLTESLGGAYCGGHSRVVRSQVEQTVGNPTSVLHALYAGGIPLPERSTGWSLFAALSSYRPPSVLRAIGNLRDVPYVHTETKRVRNVIRFDRRLNPPVHKTDLMTNTWCLGSLQGGILQPVQQHTWDITWLGSAENSTLFTVHPQVSARELGMFFPEEIHGLTATVTAQKGTYASPDKLVSSSAFEKVFQHENVLLALYQVPPGERFGHVDLYVPDCLAWSETDGWMFGRDGSFHVAVHPCREGTWRVDDGFRRYRGPADRAAFVVVAPSVDGEETFEAFRTRVLASPKPRLEGTGDGLTLAWSPSKGPRLRRVWGEPHGRVDDVPAAFPDAWLFRGPFLESRTGSGVVTLTDGATSRVLDFNDFTIEVTR